jgi:PTH1 family peptidyl-tRNA hydrolase
MNLIVGLGNPEEKYKQNRHNVGFMVIDSLLGDLAYTTIKKANFKGLLYKHSQTLLLKPLTYMNLSGQSVRAVSDYFEPEKIIVIHDDLDLEFGMLRFKFGGGNGGHNGLKSIDSHIGKDYLRVRIGIGKPQDKDKIVSHVLSDFATAQKEKLQDILSNAKDASMALLDEDLNAVSQKYTLKNR